MTYLTENGLTMYVDKKTIAAVVLALAVGAWASSSASTMPEPRPSRPVVSWIAKAARTALWIMLFADKQDRQECRPNMACDPGDGCIDHARSL